MKTEKYNGWTNYETWRTALEFFDGMEADDFIEKFEHETEDEYLNRLTEFLENYIHEYQENQKADNFYNSVIYMFFQEVNFCEIAENMIGK